MFVLMSTYEGGPWGALQVAYSLIKWAVALIWCLSLEVDGSCRLPQSMLLDREPGASVKGGGLRVLDYRDLLASLSQIPLPSCPGKRSSIKHLPITY